MKSECDDSQIKEFLEFTTDEVQYIKEETYKLLKEGKYVHDKDLHSVIYKIHQKAYNITKVSNRYFQNG